MTSKHPATAASASGSAASPADSAASPGGYQSSSLTATGLTSPGRGAYDRDVLETGLTAVHLRKVFSEHGTGLGTGGVGLSKVAVADLSFRVPPSSVFALLGANVSAVVLVSCCAAASLSVVPLCVCVLASLCVLPYSFPPYHYSRHSSAGGG